MLVLRLALGWLPISVCDEARDEAGAELLGAPGTLGGSKPELASKLARGWLQEVW